MKKFIFFNVFILSLLLISCNSGDGDNNDNIDSLIIPIDTLITEIDTTSSLPDSLKGKGYVESTEEIEKEIEKKFGKQWDFCDCIVKQDSVNKAAAKDGLTDAQYDALFDRMDVIDKHCMALTATPNTTPEERQKHERKVKKCLKNAGIK